VFERANGTVQHDFCVIERAKNAGLSRASRESSTKQEKRWNFLLLIINEKQLFSKKTSKSGLHFFRTWGIIISVFGAHRVLPAGSAYAIGAGMNDTLLLFVPNETKTQTNNLK